MSTALGQIKSLDIDITSPLKLTVKGMSPQRLTILVGANGTGKTLLMINSWCLAMAANTAILKRVKRSSKPLMEVVQQIYDRSFADQNFDGTVSALFESGFKISVAFAQGKVQGVSLGGVQENIAPLNAIYMSSNMRTFDAIGSYLKVRKHVLSDLLRGSTMQEAYESFLDTMNRDYKLYDVMYTECLIQRVPAEVTKVMQTLSDMMGEKLPYKQFNVDLERGDFFLTDVEGGVKYLTTFGKGHQAAFNMFIGAKALLESNHGK